MDTPIIPPKKRCAKCGVEYPATSECFESNKKSRDGLHSYCRECKKKSCRDYYAKNRERLVQYSRDRRKNEGDKVRAQQKVGRARNKQKIYERNKAYRERNQDKVRGFERKYSYTPKGKARKHRRYAREKELPRTLTGEQWQQSLQYWKGCCAICGRPDGFWHRIVPDHWIPLMDKREGNPGSVIGNIIPMCDGIGGCNTSKRNEEPETWLKKRLGEKKAKSKLKKIRVYFDWVRSQYG